MSPLEVKKTKLELMKCQTAKMELEYKIEERLQDIQRIQDHIKLQEDREIELMAILENADVKGDS